MRTNNNYYPVYIKLNIGLAKKFVWVFSIRCYGKTCTNFLANPIEKIAVNLALVWGEYIGMFFENVSLCESFMKNTDLAGAIQADLRCVKADKTVSNAEVSH